MTTITLDIPEDLARQLDGFDLLELLQIGLSVKQADDDTPIAHNGTPPTDNDEELIYDPSLGPLPIYPPYIPDEPFELPPPDPVPPFTSPLSREERREQLLSMSQWSEETIQEIENAREYVNRWRPGDWADDEPIELPKSQRTLSKAAWKELLLTMPPLDDETLQEIENAREYINQWNRRELF